MDWTTFDGNPEVIRLSASLLDRREGDCGDFAAIKARPQLRPQRYEKRRYTPWADFPLGLVMSALDALEFSGDDIDDAIDKVISGSRDPVHPGAVAWIRHACHTYQEVAESLATQLAAEGVNVRPERNPRIVQGGRSVAEWRSLTAWGRWYVSTDGSYVEFRRLRMRHPFGSADAASTLAAAYIAGAGDPLVDHRELYTAIPVPVRKTGADPQRIRVVEIGLTTGADRVLLDATPERIRNEYSTTVRPAATRLLMGGERIPGKDCADCKTCVTCNTLAVAPGLLGLADRGTHRRTWSITTSRYYEICPAQAHLRELRLPGEWDSSMAVQRGRDVHRWLEAAHGRGIQCTLADLPAVDADDCGIADNLMERADYHQARSYLIQHLHVCPLRGPGAITEVRPEPKIAAYDPTADVVVLANPDLLRRVDGRLVYREQKTSAVSRGITTENALSVVPQLALAVCLIAAGVFGEPDGLVELEQLHPDYAEPVLEFDTADPEIVAAARAVIHQRTQSWHRDVTFGTIPGWWCQSCPVSRWCPEASAGSVTTFDPATGEVLPARGALDIRTEAVADMVAEPEIDDEPPF
ncbi:PD-(D/E)XK nuclease family protein [Nonomuraea sp. H19]|uniref:PD-(D/E)XK nuclease family protein n=1 Tax=Nonomuraea sp. H19 TaxID=3452206 RepID=UPI003F89C5C0